MPEGWTATAEIEAHPGLEGEALKQATVGARSILLCVRVSE